MAEEISRLIKLHVLTPFSKKAASLKACRSCFPRRASNFSSGPGLVEHVLKFR
jgi:hypothetical protein